MAWSHLILSVPVLSGEHLPALADQLPDTPETVIAASQLRHGRARAWVDSWPQWQTAVVEDRGQPGEPLLFGPPAAWVAALFRSHFAWCCLNVSSEHAAAMSALFTEQAFAVRGYRDLYHTLVTAVTPSATAHPARLLTAADLPLLAAAPPSLVGAEPALLLQRAAAGVIVDGQLVAVAQNYALSARYGDVGVATLPAFRQRGYATQATALVAQWLQANGRIPVWSCGADNHASRRVAAKLGFKLVSHRVYLILSPGAAHQSR